MKKLIGKQKYLEFKLVTFKTEWMSSTVHLKFATVWNRLMLSE